MTSLFMENEKQGCQCGSGIAGIGAALAPALNEFRRSLLAASKTVFKNLSKQTGSGIRRKIRRRVQKGAGIKRKNKKRNLVGAGTTRKPKVLRGGGKVKKRPKKVIKKAIKKEPNF